MEALSTVSSDLEILIAECLGSLPFTFNSLTNDSSSREDVSIGLLINRARNGLVSTLPYAKSVKGTIHWVSFGGDSRGLLEYAEDLRSWVLPEYGTIGELEFARTGSSGRLAKLVNSVSPAGYLRWASGADSLKTILAVLNQMHLLLSNMPDMSPVSPPSVHVLRFRFVSALRCGEWEEAEQVINDIDRWNLDQAHKTMQMRLRLFGESRKYHALLEMVERHDLWSLTHPTLVAEAIVDAVIYEVLHPLEQATNPEATSEALRPWFAKLITILPLVPLQIFRANLFAYFAYLDGDRATALGLEVDLVEPLATFIREHFKNNINHNQDRVSVETAFLGDDAPSSAISLKRPDPGLKYWEKLQLLIRQGSPSSVELHLTELNAHIAEDSQFLDAVPDLLLELISDPVIESTIVARNALQELLTALVDIVVRLPGFPNASHLEVYLSVAEALVYVRGESASEEDAHLLHGLLAAIANLSSATLPRCSNLLRAWWKLRPILPRLDWLLGVMDSLAPLHPKPGELVDLWVEAVGLAKRKHVVLSKSQLRMWQRVSELLELDAENVKQDLADLRPFLEVENADVLSGVRWQKIAIVSLQETAAREAAQELQLRTGAEVILVNSLVQDGLTKSAKSADVILMVWASCSHAVYRAFDECRSRVAYVQGTGTSSILAAAERWVEKNSAK